MTLTNPFEDPPMTKIKIQPLLNGEDFLWMCPSCKGPNEMMKSDISENKAYICGNCGYTWTIGRIPDEIRGH